MTKITSALTIRSLLVLAVLLLSSTEAPAQFPFRDEPDEASERHALTELLDMEIEDIDMNIGLSDVQTRQLKLAAKAVINKAIANREIVMLPRGGIGRETLNLKGYFSDEDEETEGNAFDEDDGLIQRVAMPINKSDVLESELWKKAILSVLTEEQKRIRLQQEEEFEARIRKAAVEYRLMQLAYKLRLAVEQYDKMRTVIDRVQGADLARNLKRGNDMDAIFQRQRELEDIQRKDVEEFLTDAQLDRFSSLKIPGLDGRLNAVPKAKKDAQKLGVVLEGTRSLLVKTVHEGTIADELGVKVGDTIDKIDASPIDSRRQLRQAIEKSDEITSMTVIRDGETIVLESK